MGKITRFEDLICWQKARLLASDIYHITLDNGYLNKDEVLVLQKRARETRAVTLGLLKYVNKSRSSDKISESVGNYGDRQTSIILPDKFMDSEHPNILTR